MPFTRSYFCPAVAPRSNCGHRLNIFNAASEALFQTPQRSGYATSRIAEASPLPNPLTLLWLGRTPVPCAGFRQAGS